MTDKNTRVAAISGEGVLLRRGPTVVLVAPPVVAETVEEIQGLFEVAVREERIRRLGGAFLRHEVTAAAVVDFADGGCDVFAVGAVDVVADGQRSSAAGHLTGLSIRFEGNSLEAIVTAGAPVPDVPAWQSLSDGAISGSGAVFGSGSPASDGASTDEGPAGNFELVSLSEPMDLSDRVALPGLPPPSAPLPVAPSAAPAAPAEPPPVVAPAAPSADEPPPSIATTTSSTVDGVHAASVPAYAEPVQVLGVRSPRGYFNHPEAKFCSRTGVKIGASETRNLIYGDRPALGVFTMDDGSTYSVQWDTIIGREPELDQRVISAAAAPVTLIDPQLEISRRHVLIELRDWDVLITDLDTPNGTGLKKAGAEQVRRLARGERVVLETGDEVFVGGRSFTYHEHHVR